MSDLMVIGYPDEETAGVAGGILHGEDPKAPTWEQPAASAGAPAPAT